MRFSNFALSAMRLCVLTAFTVSATVTATSAADIEVPIDQARTISLKSEGAGIIVGNPSIADVTVQNGKLLIVTGKSVGVTNIIVLDSRHRKVLSKRISVKSDTRRIVTVTKGTQLYSFACKPTCRPALIPGDEVTQFDALAKSTQTKLSIAQSVAEGGQAPQ